MVRPLFYVFFAYSFAAHQISLVSFLNILLVTGIISISYLVNDYYDGLLRDDKNYISELLKTRRLTNLNILTYGIFVVGVVCILFAYVVSQIENVTGVASLLVIGGVLSIVYSWPPFRLKDRGVGPFIFPVSATILFFESWLVHNEMNTTTIILAGLIFLFQVYLELLHLISDAQNPREKIRIKPKNARSLAFVILGIGFIGTLILGIIFHSLFFVGTIFWFIRLISFMRTADSNIPARRAYLWSPLLSVYEFFCYALAGLTYFLS